MVLSSDGSALYVAGSTTGATTNSNLLGIAYDPATGQRRWVRTFDGPVHGIDFADSIALAPDGSTVYAVGWGHWDSLGDMLTVAFDASTGHRTWVAHYDDPKHKTDHAGYNDAGLSPDGTKLYVLGTDAEHGGDYLTVAYDTATGTELWHQTYDDGDGGYDQQEGLVVNPDGSAVYISGYSFKRHHNFDFATIAYSA
jgi:outer membrane protein assembly factor BamB